MATDIRALPAFLSTDADFRNWIIGLQAQFTAMGLVQTADTGQINTATVTKPAGTNTAAGYDVWRFADALQATLPVFIKIEYGTSGSADRPGMWWTVGTATNGAGTITGQAGTRRNSSSQSSKTAGATLNSYCSGSTSRLSQVTNLDPSLGTFSFTTLIERTRDAAGVETADGIITCFVGPTQTNLTLQVIPPVGTVPTQGGGNGPFVTMVGNGMQSAAGTNVSLLPSLVAVNGKVLFGTFCGYMHADIGELVTFTATHLGASHTFMPLGDGGPGPLGSVLSALAMRWE